MLSFVSVKWTVSPTWTRMTGAGAVPLNVQTLYFTSGAISWTVSCAESLTFTTVPVPAPVIRYAWPGAFADAPAGEEPAFVAQTATMISSPNATRIMSAGKLR